MVLWVVTLKKYEKLLHHDPKHKLTAPCWLSSLCTDSTGSHHTILVKTKTHDINEVRIVISGLSGYIHITRIELVDKVYK